jgi:hypothetical protein
MCDKITIVTEVFFIAKITTNYYFTSCEAGWYDNWSLSADKIHWRSVGNVLSSVEIQEI